MFDSRPFVARRRALRLALLVSPSQLGRVGILSLPFLLLACATHSRDGGTLPSPSLAEQLTADLTAEFTAEFTAELTAESAAESTVEARHDCGPRAPVAIEIHRDAERSGAIVVTVLPAVTGRVRVRPLEPTSGFFEATATLPATEIWELEVAADATPTERTFLLEGTAAAESTEEIAVQLEGLDARGEVWISIDAVLPPRTELPTPPAELVRHPVLLPLPGGGSCVEYMTRSEAERRGLEIVRATAPAPLADDSTEKGGE